MDYLLALVQDIFGYSEKTPIVFIGLLALAAFIVTASVMQVLLSSRSKTLKRLRSTADVELHDALGIKKGQLFQEENESEHDAATIEALDKYLTPKQNKERAEQEAKLRYAGYYGSSALTNFYAIKTALAIVLPGVVLGLLQLNPDISTDKAVFYTFLAAAIGVMLPNYLLQFQVNRRQRVLRNSFPDAMDMLVVCVESGMGLDAAFHKVSENLDLSAPELAREFATVNAGIRLGMSRARSLQEMLKRTGLVELKGLISILDQSARFGSSVGESLRIYAEDFRDKRTQAAEEKAAKIGTKLIFPMVLCIWPSFFVVAVGPAVLNVIDALDKL